MHNNPPAVKHTWYPAGTSIAKLQSSLTAKYPKDFKCCEPISISSSTNNDPRCYKQRNVKW